MDISQRPLIDPDRRQENPLKMMREAILKQWGVFVYCRLDWCDHREALFTNGWSSEIPRRKFRGKCEDAQPLETQEGEYLEEFVSEVKLALRKYPEGIKELFNSRKERCDL